MLRRHCRARRISPSLPAFHHPPHKYSTTPFSTPLLIRQQTFCIKASTINWKRSKLVDPIKMKPHFLTLMQGEIPILFWILIKAERKIWRTGRPFSHTILFHNTVPGNTDHVSVNFLQTTPITGFQSDPWTALQLNPYMAFIFYIPLILISTFTSPRFSPEAYLTYI